MSFGGSTKWKQVSGSHKEPLLRDRREAVVRGCSGERDVGRRGGRGTGRDRRAHCAFQRGPSSPSPCPSRNATFPNCHEDRPHSESRAHRVMRFSEKSHHSPQFHSEIQRRTHTEGVTRAPCPEPSSRLVPRAGLPRAAPPRVDRKHAQDAQRVADPQERLCSITGSSLTQSSDTGLWGAGGMAPTETPPCRAFIQLF